MGEPMGADRWVALPRPGRPRFVVPATTRRLAHAGLAVYHPVTWRGLAAWAIARVAARLGAFRLLPAVEAPVVPPAVRDAFPGSVLAVQASPRPSRRSGLALDLEGRPIGIAKIADDPDGAAKLEREGSRMRELGRLLGPPVTAPGVLLVQPGVLCFPAEAWRPRLRAWELPAEVAAAMGAFYRRGGGDDHGGPAHGDFAPWNLLRLADGGWLLIDWEDATSDGLPFQDPFHWLLQSHAFLGRPGAAEILAGVDVAGGKGWISRALDAYAAAADLACIDRMAALRAFLGRTATALELEGRGDRRDAVARRELLCLAEGRPTPALAVDDR